MSISAYKRVLPELDFGFYDIHSDQVVDVRLNSETALVELKASTLASEHANLMAMIEEFEEVEEAINYTVFSHKWWIIYERMHVSPLSKQEMRELYEDL